MFVILYIAIIVITAIWIIAQVQVIGNLDALDKLTRKAQKLQAIAAELRPFLELVRQLDGKDFTVPTDRLIRAHEAAKILGVGQSTIGQFVKTGLLTPLYVNSDQRRFWLSEVMKLPRKKPWRIGGERHD